MFTPGSKSNSPSGTRKLPRASEKRILQRHPQSDLAFRFQRHNELHSTESTPTRQIESEAIDPVYLALKQATGRYANSSRRGSSAHNFDSASPSPRNLSQVSLQDSGYAETNGSRNQLLGSTPMLDHPGSSSGTITSSGRPRAPKLNKQMKSLSLDCAEMPPPVSNTMRSPYKMKPSRHAQDMTASSGTSDWERSVSPVGGPFRRLPPQPPITSTHVVTHEYSNNECYLMLGERLMIVDNGDPDWLHGIKISDQTHTLLTFPKTCVAPIIPGEQPMKLSQNVNLIESRIRLYRDQVVFAQPNSMREDRIKVRNERGTIAECPLMNVITPPIKIIKINKAKLCMVKMSINHFEN
uniref:SH3 domain-containing protein n=1 Tax=Panagrolaimus sp. JU765 TaxID=591449 RepID=A0AC34QHY6_9BILA